MSDVEIYTPILSTIPNSDGLAVVCDYDYSDAPAWAVPREWFVEGRYDLEWESI
jgi:hypothetical protein